MRRAGARVQMFAADVADERALGAIIAGLERPLAGVLHAAGVVDDGPLLGLTRSRVEGTLRGKAIGAWNLERLARNEPLDFFVLFGSAAAVLGSPVQAAYMAANAFLDALAVDMRSRGRPALSIDWGPWADAGMAEEARRKREREATVSMVRLLPPERGLDAFERLLGSGVAQAIALPFDVRSVLQFFNEGAGLMLFSELLEGDTHVVREVARGVRLHPRPQMSQSYVAPRDETERLIAGFWQRALGIEQVGTDDNFFELGGDSVFAGQLVAQVNRAFGIELTLGNAFDLVTVAHWADLVREHLTKKAASLSDAEVERLLAERHFG